MNAAGILFIYKQAIYIVSFKAEIIIFIMMKYRPVIYMWQATGVQSRGDST